MKTRIIDMVRVIYPEGLWAYDPRGHRWVNLVTKESVEPRAKLSPRWDGDDEGYETVYWISKTNQTVPRIEIWLMYEAAKRNP